MSKFWAEKAAEYYKRESVDLADYLRSAQGITINVKKPSPTLPPLIGLSGYAGSGKNQVAALLGMLGYSELGFADALKAEVADAIRAERRLAHGEPVGYPGYLVSLNLFSPDEVYAKPTSQMMREILQWWGTELRRSGNQSYWVHKLENTLDTQPRSLVVVSDVRFPNEVDMIRRRGGQIWLIDRGLGPLNAHESEWVEPAPDRVISNKGLLKDLVVSVKEALGRV